MFGRVRQPAILRDRVAASCPRLPVRQPVLRCRTHDEKPEIQLPSCQTVTRTAWIGSGNSVAGMMSAGRIIMGKRDGHRRVPLLAAADIAATSPRHRRHRRSSLRRATPKLLPMCFRGRTIVYKISRARSNNRRQSPAGFRDAVENQSLTRYHDHGSAPSNWVFRITTPYATEACPYAGGGASRAVACVATIKALKRSAAFMTSPPVRVAREHRQPDPNAGPDRPVLQSGGRARRGQANPLSS